MLNNFSWYSIGKEKPFKCDHCEKPFPLKIQLNFHIKKNHSEIMDESEKDSGIDTLSKPGPSKPFKRPELFSPP